MEDQRHQLQLCGQAGQEVNMSDHACGLGDQHRLDQAVSARCVDRNVDILASGEFKNCLFRIERLALVDAGIGANRFYPVEIGVAARCGDNAGTMCRRDPPS